MILLLAALVPLQPPGPALFPGGLTSPDGSRAFVETAGGVTAIDPATGKILWVAPTALRPLAVHRSGLLALGLADPAPALRIVRLDPATGAERSSSAAIRLPDWVTPDDSATVNLRTMLRFEGNQAVLDWAAARPYRGGPPPDPALEKSLGSSARGTATIDLESGAVQQSDRGSPEQEVTTPLPPSAPYLRNGEWQSLGWSVGGQVRSITSTATERGARVWLELPESGQRRDLLSLPEPVVTVTADGEHVLLRSAVASPENVWHVFSARSGDRVGQVPYRPQATDPIATGNRLYYFVPLDGGPGPVAPVALEAASLESGRVLWSRELERRRQIRALPR